MDETERLESTLYSIKNWAEQILGIAQRIRDDNDIEQINKVVAQSRQIILEANQAIAEAHPEPAAPPPAAASDDAPSRERLAARDRYMKRKAALDKLMHDPNDNTSVEDAAMLVAHAGDAAVAYIAALESALEAAEETVKFREATIRDLCDKLDLEGIDCDDCRDFAATADAANALADGGE